MGKRTGAEPDGSQSILWRICHALDITPAELAKAIGVKYRDVRELLELRPGETDFVGNDTWWKISEYLSHRVGLTMAARVDLQRALQKDRKSRVERHMLVRTRRVKPSPR